MTRDSFVGYERRARRVKECPGIDPGEARLTLTLFVVSHHSMAKVFIPAQWRDLSGGVGDVELDGATLGEIIAALERRFPGIATRVCEGELIAAGLAVSIDGSVTSRGMRAPVKPGSEIHFLPAIGGG